MKKIVALILVAVMCVLCLAGCGAKKQTLKVGITEYEPMNYKDAAGNWTGFDTEFALAVAEELGMEVEFIVIDWDNKILEVNSGAIDCVWNGMTLTEEVLAGMDCTDPYIKNAQVVVLKADKAADYATVDSVKTLKFAVESGSAGEQALKDNGIEGYTAVLDQAAALLEVKSGAADACVIDITMANAMTGEGTSYADLTYTVSLTSEEYGIGFAKGSDMPAKVNAVMKKLIESGKLDEIAAKYDLTNALISNQK
jgi:polar amino acid transport system substrate-binding protein